MAPRTPRPAPVEAGAVEDEMRVDDPVPGDAEQPPNEPPSNVVSMMQPDQPEGPPIQADLSGPEVSEIRNRNDTVDKQVKAAETAREAWVHQARIAQYGQEALTALISNLIRAKGLDEGFRYRVDLEQGRIVPVGRIGDPQ